MGHTLGEMAPGIRQVQEDYFERLNKLEAGLGDVTLDKFTVNELEAVMKLKGLFYNTAGQVRMYEEDFVLLEKKLAELKKN
jgi:hypothetical protein